MKCKIPGSNQSAALKHPHATIFIACLVVSAFSLSAATRYVDGTSGCFYQTGDRNCDLLALRGPYPMIGQAVRQFGATSPGDTLMIRGGRYNEPIVFNKRLEIRAYDGPVTIGPQSLAPFDLVASAVDDNGLPLNPKWGAQITNPGTLPNVSQCGGDAGSGACTHQFTDRDRGFFGCGPHVNWFGATYQGTVYWEGHSCPVCDDDYNLIFQGDGAGYVGGVAAWIKCEFDSRETVDRFNPDPNTWWQRFHRTVDADGCKDCYENAPIPCCGAQNMLGTNFAIVTGLMGLDCEHECGPELHPVWALAMNVQPSDDDDLWVFFARNWGNEGYCGWNQHPLELPNNRYTVRLPWKTGATSVSVIDQLTKWHPHNTQQPMPTITIFRGTAILVTFALDAPTAGFSSGGPGDGSMWDGELHLQWIMQ